MLILLFHEVELLLMMKNESNAFSETDFDFYCNYKFNCNYVYCVSISQETDDRNNSVRLLRDSTNICIGTSGTNRNAAIIIKTRSNRFMECYTQTFLDSPNTTSATTYKLQWAAEGSGGARYIYLNRLGQSTDAGAVSSITVMEVAA